MATTNLCRGEQCPVKRQCLRFTRWIKEVLGGNVHPKCISKCPNGKWFERDGENAHPQHSHPYPEKRNREK